MGILNRFATLFQGYNWLVIPAALLCVVFHEISHGYVAFLMGDRTAKNAGRLSLNPIKHIDVIGLLCMIFFRFGWAKPVPVNPGYFRHKRLGMVIVALAGPASNFIFAIISLVAWGLLSPAYENGVARFFLEFFNMLAILNVGLGVFNLIPIPPLDGSKVVFSVLPERAYHFVLKYEQMGFIILILLLNIPIFQSWFSSAAVTVLTWLAALVGV